MTSFEPSQALMLPEDYVSGATLAEQIEDLEKKADNCAYFTRTQALDERQMASLRVVTTPEPYEADDEQKPSAYEKCKGFFCRSYNSMLLESTMSRLEAIDAAIREDGTFNVQGYVVDGIKPVLPGKIVNCLPVIYDENLSGTPESGNVPGWVREPEGDEEIFTLYKVQGSDGDGIVSASSCTDWQVRESIVYVQETEAETIKKLKDEGYYELSPNEDGPTESKASAVQDGSVLMMGRQVLALKEFEEPVEGDSQALPARAHTDTTKTAFAPNSNSEGPAIHQVVTNPPDATVDAPSTDLFQSRKKRKT